MYRLALLFCFFVLSLQCATAAEPMDFWGLFSKAESVSGTWTCESHNPLTGACNCPPGAVENNGDIQFLGTTSNMMVSYCVNASLSNPKTFGGAFQTMQTTSGDSKCLAKNLYTKDCSCPGGFHPFAAKVHRMSAQQELLSIAASTAKLPRKGTDEIASYLDSELAFCVPNDNVTIPGGYGGMYIQQSSCPDTMCAGVPVLKCYPSNTQIVNLSNDFGCECPDYETAWKVKASRELFVGEDHNTFGFCFAECGHHDGNPDMCNKLHYCSYCGKGTKGLCLNVKDGVSCCENDAGAAVCLPTTQCCKVPGQQPTCCGGENPTCDAATGTCSCNQPDYVCGTATGKAGWFENACCASDQNCCLASGVSSCCSPGSTCCGEGGPTTSCCPPDAQCCGDGQCCGAGSSCCTADDGTICCPNSMRCVAARGLPLCL